MRLIVGLGNPGPRYEHTPHNAGFIVCDRFAERHRLGAESRKFDGLLQRGRVRGDDVAVLKPQTYMNLSGDSVAEAMRYLPIETEDLIVVWDEMDLPEGRVRVRRGGGDGGHRGTRSIIERIGTDSFARLRVGVGRPPGEHGATGHLLGRIRDDEHKRRFDETVDRAVDALDCMLEHGIQEAMNRFNGLPGFDSEEEGKE